MASFIHYFSFMVHCQALQRVWVEYGRCIYGIIMEVHLPAGIWATWWSETWCRDPVGSFSASAGWQWTKEMEKWRGALLLNTAWHLNRLITFSCLYTALSVCHVIKIRINCFDTNIQRKYKCNCVVHFKLITFIKIDHRHKSSTKLNRDLL